MEKAVLQNRVERKEPIAFCKESEHKGKPIFNMVLTLFSFSAKTKLTIRGIMRGIDGVCNVSPESIVESCNSQVGSAVNNLDKPDYSAVR